MKLTLEELEYYDEKEVIRPVVRLHRQKIKEKWPKYATIETSSFAMKDYYDHGLVDLPKTGDFKPWKDYEDGRETAIEQFYHQFQFVPLKHLILLNNISLKPKFLEEVTDVVKVFDNIKKIGFRNVKSSQESAKGWNSKIGLLMLLEEAYGFNVGSLMVNPGIDSKTFFENWRHWRINEFQTEKIVKTSGMTRDQTKELYGDLVSLGRSADPLFEWFVLLQLINNAKKKRLMKGALLAQEYYKLARMVAFYIYDLTKEKMLDPDDYLDGVEGKWKTDIYGEPFNYQSKETRIRILDNYLINRPFQIALIYEGETEDYVLHEIFKVLNIDEDSAGVFLWKAKGQGNIEKNMYGLAELARAIEMRIFLILDRDANWNKIIDEFKRRRYINDNSYCVWNKDFESDNFTLDQVVNVVNTVLEQKNLGKIEKDQIGDRMDTSNVGVTKAISNLIWDDKGMKLEDVISKAELARTLIEPRISEIKTERDNDNEWKPLLPIEKELRRIFEMIPRIIG